MLKATTRSAAITSVVESQLENLFEVFNDYHWTASDVQLLADCLSIVYSLEGVNYEQLRTICHIAANVKMSGNQSQTDRYALDALRKLPILTKTT